MPESGGPATARRLAGSVGVSSRGSFVASLLRMTGNGEETPNPLRQLQHPQQRLFRRLSHILRHDDLRALVAEAQIELLERVQLHERALVAAAAVVRRDR